MSDDHFIEVLSSNELSLDEHVENIISKQNQIRVSVWEYIESINFAFNQLGQDVFDGELSKKLGMTASTLNRWKSIGSSKTIHENKHSLPPVFSSLYQITLLEKQYKDFYGETQGLKKVQNLINRRSIHTNTETKDITHYVDEIKRVKLDKKRSEKEQFLIEKSGKVGYEVEDNYSSLNEMVEKGVKVKTIVCCPPSDLLTKWSDPSLTHSDLNNEFPISEIRGRSELQPINIFIVVTNNRIDVGLKILKSSGFSFRQVFYPKHTNSGFFGKKSDLIVVYGQRGAGGSGELIKSESLTLNGVIEISEKIGHKPYLLLFDKHDGTDWLSVENPI